ncbi:gamma-glutamyl-gamma-aminobutyrate hydrolase family protein [Litchfieldella xinjiangensis]|uniref:gamma-glutamyl-gamma-aminobutyrate hydrolase family protein n=1 Tax=Litchfieldella xinjiangensis TaxID=1166948 RepID=UPI0005BD46B1|nr:gamma-glutamyl-gamma-aminobutyrate hydrolase family protein [Halomonas xinjiangensis]
MQTRPLVGVIACRRDVEGHPAHVVTDKYLTAVRDYGLEPIILPVWETTPTESAHALLARLDGLLLTGSYSNVEPARYGAERAPENTRADRHRDTASLAWAPLAVNDGIPLFGICRGFQEINVAYGGSLHQAVQNQPGLHDHREPDGDMPVRYAPAHEIELLPDGQLAQLYAEPTARVNSLHQQGIERLGDGLKAEAVAPDGLIEAISVTQARAFAVAVQWHPEWQPHAHPLNDALFSGFADACRKRLAQRLVSPALSPQA